MPRTAVGDIAELDADRLRTVAEPAGVRIRDFLSEVREGRRTVAFGMDFDSLEGFSWVLCNVLDEKSAGLGVFAGDAGTLVFQDAVYDFAALAAQVPALPDRTDPGDEAMDAYLELRDVINAQAPAAAVVNVVRVPGDVVETDATTVEGRTCTWDLDFAAIVADKDTLKPRIVFHGDGLTIEPLAD